MHHHFTKKEDIDQTFIDAVENECGMGCGAWDMVDPREIILGVTKEYEKRRWTSWANSLRNGEHNK